MLSVSDQCNGTGTHPASNRTRWLVAIAAFAIGIVPLCQIAKAVGPSPACSGATYSVVSGDSWSRIASRNSVSMTALMNANSATTATVIHPGQTLCLPGSAATVATTITTAAPATAAAAAPAPASAPSVSINVFPAQGPCSYGDTYGAPRGGGRFHEGVDIIANAGRWVYAVQDGTLTKKYVDTPGSLSGNGWRLTVAGGTYFFYAHLSAFAPGLSVGSAVRAGQIIGQVGMTGDAPIPHLHFEVHPGGGASVNPTPVVRAVDGCHATAVPTQPDGSVPATAPTTTVPTTGPVTTVPATPVDTPPPAHRRDLTYAPGLGDRPRRPVPTG
jgi:LysM repeat protein